MPERRKHKELRQPYCHVYEWLQTGFVLDIGFTGHFQTWSVSTLNYNAIVNLHTLQITAAHAKAFHSVFTMRSLVKLLTVGFFSFCAHFIARWSSTAPTKSSLHRLPYNRLTSESELLQGFTVLATNLLRTTISNFTFQLITCGHNHYVISSLTKDESVVYNCCCTSPAQSFQVRVPGNSWSQFTVSDSRLP
jgi:hypothetical protein